LLPPGILILLLWTGIALLSRRRHLGRRLVVLATVLLTAFSLPVVSKVLCRGIEVYPPLSDGDLVRGAQAIVVLAGGWTRTPEYRALGWSYLALHEYLGRLWYAIRY
jgi:hypothetical protein